MMKSMRSAVLSFGGSDSWTDIQAAECARNCLEEYFKR